MFKNTSDFVAKVGLSLAGLCAVLAVFASNSSAAAVSSDECPPPTTVTVDINGNPWHG